MKDEKIINNMLQLCYPKDKPSSLNSAVSLE